MKEETLVRNTSLQRCWRDFVKTLVSKAETVAEVKAFAASELDDRSLKAPIRKAGANRKRKHEGQMQTSNHNPDIICLKCGKKGHPMAKCPDKPTGKEMAELLLVCRIGKVVDNVNPGTLDDCGNLDKSSPHRNVDEARNSGIEVKIAASGILFPGILDSGAEATIIPMSIAMKIRDMDPDKTRAQATHEVYADLTLQTATGELITRNRRCLVWDTPSDEVFIGEDLLKELGIDPKTALEHLILRTRLRNQDLEVSDEDVNIGENIPEELRGAMNGLVERDTVMCGGHHYVMMNQLR
uniref:CCHC-type domain-containing protein n=1 Tax=Spongospora subterranea TaxID=70186 RepID=A0A0H5RI00_9EUKA|eukprot:CRZ08288.1 hypothetical protein [Spongospora subterranea]